MPEPECLRLIALDEEDLAIVSAHVQDAVMKVADVVYLPAEKRFALAMNRFAWEKAEGRRTSNERHRAALSFDRVRSVKVRNIDRGKPDMVLNLLALEYSPVDAPEGTIELFFAGGATMRLEVECIEARLSDLGPAWAAAAKPCHDEAVAGGGD